MERSSTPRVSQQARGAGQQQHVKDVNDTSESKRGLAAAGMLRTPSPPVVRASSPNAGGGGASLISWMKTALSLQGQGQGNQQSHDAVGGASASQTDAAAALPAATPQLVAMPKQERQTDRSNANRRSAGPPVRRPSTISTTSSGGKSSTMSRLSVYDDDDDDDDDDEEEEEVELGENAEGNFRRRTGRRRRSATTQQTEDSEVDSEAEETFTPFAPASMPPALVKPTARAGGTTLSFARSASDGSDFYNQLEAEKERSAGAGADQTPRIPAAAESVSHSTSDRHLSLGDAQETGEVVRDTTERTQYAPALVLTPPDELSPVQEMSPIAGWVEDDRFEPTPVAGRPPRSPNQAQVLSPSLGTAMSDLTSAGGSKGDLETDGDGDGEALEDPLGRPRTPAQMMAERQSREKVVLGTRGASIRELNSGSRQQRRERQARQNASTPRPHAEKEAELGQADVASATEWDESRSKTPKAFALDNKRGASTPDSARRIASEVAPSTPSTANAASSKVGPSASPITTPTPLDAPSPRRATRLNFFGRKGRTQEGSAGSLLASVAGSSGTNSGHGSAVNTDDEEVMASTSDVGSVATPQTAQMPHSAASGLFSPRTPGTANSLNRAPSGSSSAGFWRIGRGMRRDDSASSAVVGTGKKWGVSTPNRVPEASSIPVPETPKTPSIITSDVSFDDAASIASRASRPRPLSAAGSFDGAAAQSSWGRKGRKERGAVPAIDGPRLQKVRSRNKPSKQRDFGRMMLVQELNLGASSITSPPGSRRNSDVGGRPEPSRQSTDNSSLGRRSLGPVGKPPMQHSDSMTSMSSIGASVQSHATTASSTAQSNAAATSRKRATWAMKFSLDGKYLAIAGQDTVVRVYAVLDTPEARTKEIADARARAAAMLNGQATSTNAGLCPFDGKLGAASASTTSLGTANGGGASRPGSLRTRPSLNFNTPGGNNGVPDLPVFSSEPVREFRGHTNDVLDLSWSKGGFLLSASMDKTARLWHLSTPNPLVSFVHGDFVTSACFHPKDDRFFLSGSLDGKLRLWNIPLKRVQCSQEVPGLITACAFTHSGATACVGTFAGAALFYNTDGLTYSSSIAVRSPSGKNARGGRKITGIEPIASDGASGERVLITSNDSRIRAYNLRDKSMSARWKANKTYSNRTSQIRASVADDGTFVVAGSEAGAEGGLVHVWDVGAQAGDSRSPVPGTPLSIKSPKSATTSLAPSADSVCEYWTAGAGTVTCALMAPLKTNALLVCAEDPIASDAARRKADPTSFAAAPFSAGLFGLTSPNTVSSVVGQSHVSPNHDRHCRIIASVDESAVVRIWRSDTHNVIRC